MVQGGGRDGSPEEFSSQKPAEIILENRLLGLFISSIKRTTRSLFYQHVKACIAGIISVVLYVGSLGTTNVAFP